MSIKQFWEDVKHDCAWVYNKWLIGEAWFNSKVPAMKVKIVNALTFLGTAATAAAAYMKEVPLEQIVTAKTLAITLVVVTSLSYWLRGMNERTKDITGGVQ